MATELRRRRELLGISQVKASRRTGVARTVINEIERGKRTPSLARPPRGTGDAAPPAVLLRPPPPPDLTEAHLRRLAACAVVAGGNAPLPQSDMADDDAFFNTRAADVRGGLVGP